MNSKTVEKKWHINKGTKNLTYPQKSMTGAGGNRVKSGTNRNQ